MPTHRDHEWWYRLLAETAREQCNDSWMVTDPAMWRECRHRVARHVLAKAGRFTIQDIEEHDPALVAIVYWAAEALDQHTVAGLAGLLEYAYMRGRDDAPD